MFVAIRSISRNYTDLPLMTPSSIPICIVRLDILLLLRVNAVFNHEKKSEYENYLLRRTSVPPSINLY